MLNLEHHDGIFLSIKHMVFITEFNTLKYGAHQCINAVLKINDYCKSSSSLFRQPYVGPGLPQKLLPAKYPAIASSDFVKSLFQGGVVSPTPNLQPGGYPFLFESSLLTF
jgi:hypothetical protein